MKTLMTTLTLALLLTACAGHTGGQGIQGGKGDPGASGQACTQIAAMDGSGSLLTCSNVSVFIKNGTNGSNGLNGADAIPVTVIQLCPSIVGSYGSFPEKAFKIGSKLYAVYSANNQASLTELYPGSYVTTAPNGNCAFTVHSDGSVSN